MEKESYLLELVRYIVLNPVRASMVRSTKDWPWSSYRTTVGQTKPPTCLTVDWILSAFASRESNAIEGYKQFVVEGKNQQAPWTFLKNQIYLGWDKFVERMQKQIEVDKDLSMRQKTFISGFSLERRSTFFITPEIIRILFWLKVIEQISRSMSIQWARLLSLPGLLLPLLIGKSFRNL